MSRIWEGSPEVHYVKFDIEMLDDFFYWKRVIEDYEAFIMGLPVKRSKLSEFISKLSFTTTIYIDHVSGKQVPFSIISIGTQKIVFYMIDPDSDEVFDKFYKAMVSIKYDLGSLKPISPADIPSIDDVDKIFNDGQIVWVM